MARFGDMLYQRRRQMGLSILQVANTIKIRPQIIEFFENGDFSAMPPRGYAQGMISSYARFLGLNPREVVESYFEELRAYELATDNHGGRFQDAAGLVSTRSASATGRFMMVDSAPRSRYAQRPPQAGYVSENDSGHRPQRAHSPYRRVPGAPTGERGAAYSPDRTVSMPRRGYGGSAAAGPRTAGSARSRQGSSRPYGPERGARRGSAPGRSGARTSGSAGAVDSRLLIALLGALAVIIVLLVLLLFRGCTPAQDTSAVGSTSATSTDTIDSTDTDSDSTEPQASDGSSVADGDGADGAAVTEPQQLVVKISVAEGDSSWLEIRLDGSIVYGDEVVGPFEQEYTVQDSIRITANTPASVKVTQNGEEVRWDTSTSGVARINLTAPEPAGGTDAAAAGTASTDGTASDGSTVDPNATGDATTAA